MNNHQEVVTLDDQVSTGFHEKYRLRSLGEAVRHYWDIPVQAAAVGALLTLPDNSFERLPYLVANFMIAAGAGWSEYRQGDKDIHRFLRSYVSSWGMIFFGSAVQEYVAGSPVANIAPHALTGLGITTSALGILSPERENGN